MRKKDFDIEFSGLALGAHNYQFDLDDSFFELFEYDEHTGLKATVNVRLQKNNTFLELHFQMTGELQVTCDRSQKPFVESIQNEFNLVVKFGEEYNDDDDETLIIPREAYQVSLAQYIYELIVLAIPQKHIHPDVLSGKVSLELPEVEEQEKKEIDPRWDKLKDLLN